MSITMYAVFSHPPGFVFVLAVAGEIRKLEVNEH